jgi:hypothetical protein
VNQYGAIARQHWRRWRPASYAAITDPAAYFTDLGEQAAGEITRLWAQMRDQEGNPPGEDYLPRVARLNALRKQAEEVVLVGLILLPPEHDAPGLTSRSSDRVFHVGPLLPFREARD